MEEKNIQLYANLPEPQKLVPEQATGTYHLVARSEGLVSMTVTLPSNVNSDVDFYFNRHIHKVVTAVSGVATLVTTKSTESDVEFPSEVLREPGFTTSIIYENENNQITTNYIFFPVYTNGIGEEPLEYDDDSYIDAKIAREAAEYALEEIDDLTDRITTLESGLTTLSSVVETTISSLEITQGSLETTTSSLITTMGSLDEAIIDINGLKSWTDYGGHRIYYTTSDIAGDICVTVATSTSGNTQRIYCPGVISNNQTTMEFTVNLPYRLPNPTAVLGTAAHYEIRDLAILSRGSLPGYYRDYYIHGFRKYEYNDNPTYVTTDTTISTSVVPDHHGTASNIRPFSYEIYGTISDCKNHCYGTYPQHYFDSSTSSDGERRQTSRNIAVTTVRTTAAASIDSQAYFLTSTADTSTVESIHWPTTGVSLNCPGLLVMDKGTPIGVSVWNRNDTTKNEVTSTGATNWIWGGGFEVSTVQRQPQQFRISIRMSTGTKKPFPTPSDSSEASTYIGDLNAEFAVLDSTNNQYYKKWLPFASGTGKNDVYVGSREDLDARWRCTIPKHYGLNNTNVEVDITVLVLKIVPNL